MMRVSVSKYLTGLLMLSGLLAVAVACAPSHSNSTGEKPAQEIPFSRDIPTGQADEAAATAHLTCSHDCVPGLGMFLLRLDDGAVSHFNQCVAFLVAPDIVATNSHCLTPELRTAGAPANGRIAIVFADEDSNANVRKPRVSGRVYETSGATDRTSVLVDHVISASIIDENSSSPLFTRQPDLAFLKLSRALHRAPLKLTRAGLADRATMTALVVDPVGDRFHLNGVARAVPCSLVQDTMIAPQFTNDFANIATAQCELIHGNSGSPLMGSDGYVHAIVHGILSANRAGPTNLRGYRVPKHFDAMVTLTNMSCADSPAELDLGPRASVCDETPPTQLELLRILSSSRSYDLDQSFNDWKSSAPRPFEFENSEIKGTTVGKSSLPRFVCLKSASSWARKSADTLNLDSLANTKHTVILKFTVPMWGTIPSLESTDRIVPGLGERDRVHFTVSFDLETFVKSGTARVSQTLVSEQGLLRSEPATFDLPICR